MERVEGMSFFSTFNHHSPSHAVFEQDSREDSPTRGGQPPRGGRPEIPEEITGEWFREHIDLFEQGRDGVWRLKKSARR